MATGRRAWGDVNCSGLHYQTPPRRTGLPRAVLRWLQSLDLSFFPRRFGRDFANGVLVAEIFSWYFPGDLRLGAFQNGTSLRTKLCNWARLQQVLGSDGVCGRGLVRGRGLALGGGSAGPVCGREVGKRQAEQGEAVGPGLWQSEQEGPK